MTSRCSTSSYYTFQWAQFVEELSMKQIYLKSMYLRVYLKVNPMNIHNKNITLTLTLTLFNTESDNQKLESSTIRENMTLSVLSDQWVELDLTRAAAELWPLVKDSTEVRVTVEARTDCDEQREPPLSFVNPATIPLENKELREQLIATAEPLLLVLCKDDTAIPQMLAHYTTSNNNNRGRRSATTGGEEETEEETEEEEIEEEEEEQEEVCGRKNFTINFSDFGLPFIIYPDSVDIGMCSGACTDYLLMQQGNNYAKLMSRVLARQLSMTDPASSFCCVPVSYSSLEVLIQLPAEVRITSVNNFKIDSCGCR